MLKKLIVILLLTIVRLSAQDVSIFFLKDGSIVQGQVVNENQHRIFLKTEQGTIKLQPSDILGREDAAKKGDLTFVSERLEYLQGNVNHLSGQVNHWNDSLRTALNDLYELFKDLEVLQNEFEIDLLRLHSQGREQKKKIEYVQDDLVNQRVDIASNRQDMGGLDDTVSTMNKQFSQARQKLDITANQSYLLSGNLSSIKQDIQSIRSIQENQQNQIDMMAGALANNIQEVIRVQGKFGDVEDGVDNNQKGIKKLNHSLEEKTDELSQTMRSMLKDLTNRLDVISSKIDDMDNNALKARKKLATDTGDLKNELDIISEKVITSSRDIRSNEEKLNSIGDKIDKVEGSVKKADARLSKLKSQVDEIPLPADTEN
jgi:chromosome segregation ATPase|tara:strand:+ start:89 stop:1207 length:1119 start_codon:yes stop_codon:yes gene_type:complete